MATADTHKIDEAAAAEPQLERSTYEIIRNRLTGHATDLRSRLDKLNDARREVFGSIETKLIATERITTENNCVPRDMVEIGEQFIFGYNVHFGLKTETDLSDVFAIYEVRDEQLHQSPLELISVREFEEDFKQLYKYYKNTTFAKFFQRGPHLYMVFRVGKSVKDIKAFKWFVEGSQLRYIDNRSDHEVLYPPQHEFVWVRTHRDLHRGGMHPHISIDDRLFVETVGGDLTIKIEDNTESGEGILSEPVDDPDQTLDDAEWFYAIVGNLILLRVRPYKEQSFRHFVYNEKTQEAHRLDSLKDACVLLPEGHGLIFSNGYYLQTGESKIFDSELTDLLFERRIASPNGEDHLFVFYKRDTGDYVLLSYNMIEQQVDTPIICHGFLFFENGQLAFFKGSDDPQKHHAIQLWQTPYVGQDFTPPVETDSYLYKIGNKDIVRGMAECHEILGLLDKEDTYGDLYLDLVKKSTDILDSYYWINHAETFNLDEALRDIKSAAEAAVDEFDKVVRVRRNTRGQFQAASKTTRKIVNEIHSRRFEVIDDFVRSLADLRRIRGDIISLRDLRYIDLPAVKALEDEVAEQSDRLSHRCVQFLLRDDSLAPYQARVNEQRSQIDQLTKVAEAKKLEEEIAASGSELEMLIDIVSNLKIDDATQRTQIIDSISGIYSTLNQARAALKKHAQQLMSVEGVAEFNSQIKLVGQAVVNYMDVCDTPEKCDEYLTKLMVQIEELEGRFAEFDEFIIQLTEKREEIYGAFDNKKLALVEARNKRAAALMSAADRILKGIETRVRNLKEINEIHSYFASDLMIEKVRDIIEQLGDLDDTVKVDDIQSRLKTIREDAVRQLKDRQELFVEGENIIQLGRHRFSVNTQSLDLTTVVKDGEQCFHLTGTNFLERIADEQFLATRDVWNMEVVSEDRQVYRGEYLAYMLLCRAGFQSAKSDTAELEFDATADELLALSNEDLTAFVQKFMGTRYAEGYVKGVHDHDAALILRALLEMKQSIGMLRYQSRSRALANVFWNQMQDKEQKALWSAKLKGLNTITQLFASANGRIGYVGQLQALIGNFCQRTELFPENLVEPAGEYLFDELVQDGKFSVSSNAANLCRAFHAHLERRRFADKFNESVAELGDQLDSRYALLRSWVEAFVEDRNQAVEADYVDEVAAVSTLR